MNIAEAKQISIVDYLSQIGHTAVRVRNGQYWYLSPLREEDNPSFKVNDRTNEWYDFGIAEGGDLIELGKHLYHTDDVRKVLMLISGSHAALAKEPKRAARLQVHHAEDRMGDVRIMPLSHHALLSYVQSRGIDVGIAKTFCQEIHYVLRQKAYFAIAFANRSGGYEMRNPYYKGCVRNKDVTRICHAADRRQEHICVFEGFMDFLSYMTLCRQGNMTVCIDEKIDVLVMNSVANMKKSLECLEQYKEIHCYLDNDLAGQKTVETFKGLFGERVKNEAVRYGEYKDLNDMLRGKKR